MNPKALNPNLKIYDSQSRSQRPFKSLNPGQVKMYCCGPTVYDFLHIGNFRGAVFFNFVRNWLEFLGYQVDYIYNFTDIDDKILNRSVQKKISPQKLAETFIQEFQKDYASLKLSPHTANPRATQSLKEILSLIEKLIQEKKAYEVEGDVFYSIEEFPDYGQLSGRKTEELLTGVRVEQDPKKKEPLDFALWKKSKPGETWSFESPWGKGRPGWHIECTAMIHKFLGSQIDIHAGGSDLIFPHHENEIAQASVLSSQRHVQFWMHNNMIVTKGSKMSKSLGNMMTMREFLNQYPGELFKFLMLSVHYRSPLQFSETSLQQALVSLCRIYDSLAEAQKALGDSNRLGESQPEKQKAEAKAQEILKAFEQEIQQAEIEIEKNFNEDFATPKAFAVFFSLSKSFQQKRQEISSLESLQKMAQKHLLFFKKWGKVLALFQEEPLDFLKELEDRLLARKSLSREDIDKKVQSRQLARQNKDFKQADQIRKELESLGIDVQDSPKGTSWRLKK